MAERAAARRKTILPPALPPPEDGTCPACYEWRRYPPPQEHSGWAYWRVCTAGDCDHEHHQHEVWV